MSTDERLEYITTVQRSHDEQIGKLVEQAARNEKQLNLLTARVGILTERLIQTMDAINRLTRIAGKHEDLIENLENPTQ